MSEKLKEKATTICELCSGSAGGRKADCNMCTCDFKGEIIIYADAEAALNSAQSEIQQLKKDVNHYFDLWGEEKGRSSILEKQVEAANKEIQQLKEAILIQERYALKMDAKFEAAKTILQNENPECNECFFSNLTDDGYYLCGLLDETKCPRNVMLDKLRKIFSEGFIAEKSSLAGETTK